MEEVVFKIGLHFERTFVPHGCRNARSEWFRGESHAAIRQIAPTEARSAFRITFPARLPRNPLFRQSNPDYRVPPLAIELIAHDGAIYWPYHVWHEDFDIGGEFSMEKFRFLLKEDYDLCHFLPSRPRFDSGAIDVARRIVSDDQDRNVAIANCKLRENFLICGGRPYVRGSVPFYTRDWSMRRQKFELTVGNVGAERTPMPAIGTSFTYQPFWRKETLCRGDIWLATDRKTALSASGAADDDVPTIELIAPDLVEDIRARLTLDAIFHAVCEVFDDPSSLPRSMRKHIPAVLDLLSPARCAADDATLSNKRYDVLDEWLHDGRPPPLDQYGQAFYALKDRFGLESPLFRASFLGAKPELALEDDDALGRIAEGLSPDTFTADREAFDS